MRYVYMVTTIAENLPKGFRSIPNLGAHSSLKSATKHFNSVVSDRRKFAKRVVEGRTPETGDYPSHLLRSADIEFKDGYYGGRVEEIRLERWKLKGRT